MSSLGRGQKGLSSLPPPRSQFAEEFLYKESKVGYFFLGSGGEMLLG